MNMKRKLVTGALAATLGLSLVGGGTWAAFNDVERVQAAVGAGELNLDLQKVTSSQPYHFSVSNLKPGDTMTRTIKLANTGSLAIKDVLMSIEGVQFTDYLNPGTGQPGANDTDTWGANSAVDYLNQFRVSVMAVGAEGGSGGFPHDIIPSTADVRLGEFYLASGSLAGDGAKAANGGTSAAIAAARNKVWNSVDQAYIDAASLRINGATVNPNEWTGLPVIPVDPDNLQISIQFVPQEVDSNGDGTWDQNKYQGDTATVNIAFEARQWNGQEVTDSDMNGSDVQTNRKANNGQ